MSSGSLSCLSLLATAGPCGSPSINWVSCEDIRLISLSNEKQKGVTVENEMLLSRLIATPKELLPLLPTDLK